MKRAGYIDEKKTGTLNGLEIITIQKLKIDSEIYVFVSNMYNTYEIKQNLRLHGVKDEQIIALTDYDVMACENQYFEKRCIGNIDFVKTFVDCGCYDGNDTKRFLNLSKISDKEIYAFEADLDNYNLIMNNIGHIDGVNCKYVEEKFTGTKINRPAFTELLETMVLYSTEKPKEFKGKIGSISHPLHCAKILNINKPPLVELYPLYL